LLIKKPQEAKMQIGFLAFWLSGWLSGFLGKLPL
jgi:hypothetical protein